MFETPITPRVSETDGVGHINNVFVPAWFEAGRRGIFRILTPDLSFGDWRAIIVNINVDYIDQIYLHEDAVVRTWIDRIGNKSFVIYEEIWQGERCCAKGTATYVYYGYETGRAVPIPETCRKALEAHLRETEE